MSPPPRVVSFGTEMQIRTRKEKQFSQTEATLTSYTRQAAPGWLDLISLSMARRKLSDLLSYLGAHNPRPLPISKDDELWFFDNVAFRDQDGNWQAEFIAAVFKQHPSCKLIDVVAHVADMIGLSDSERDEETLGRRIKPFLMDIQPGKFVDIVLGTNHRLRLGPGGENGISSDIRALPSGNPGDVATASSEVPKGTSGILQMKTLYPDDEGWAVISDIDDSIKITQTSDPIGILRSTFVSKPTPVAGMPELYAYLEKTLTPHSPFFYLSASPYNLYPFLHGFLDQFYPFGQLILRDSSWMNIPGLLASLTVDTEDYKVDRMDKIQAWLPRKKVICIGDSTQSDPEAYGQVYRAFPGWVRLVLIRKVTDIAALGMTEKNEPKRFERAFEGLPRSAWHVFEDPDECYKIIQDTLA